MRVLCVCDVGVNRSVTLASLLKFRDHDTLAVGVQTASAETMEMLCDWADRILVTQGHQMGHVPSKHWLTKGALWELGPDVYPRPFNRILMRKVTKMIDMRASDLKEPRAR